MVRVLYKRFIAVFGAPAKLLSDQGANITLALVEELCTMFSIQKCWTTMYHPQCNGQVERFHQMLFRMIGKLGSDKKVQWEQHLLELLQLYNSTRSVVTDLLAALLDVWEAHLSPSGYLLSTQGAHMHNILSNLLFQMN